jgi:hypothetical protein
MATRDEPPASAGPDHAPAAAAAGQDAVFALLADRETHGLMFPVTRIDTHTAVVFLAGLDVYKVKRAVRFPFLDQSTLAKRRHGCEAEVAVNRRYAPDIYLGAVPVTAEDGGLRLGGAAEPVEWAVHMRRFDETRTLDHVAERGDLEPALIARLVETLLSIYREAEVRDGDAATEALAGVVEETLESLAAMDMVFAKDETEALAAAMTAAFAALRPLLLGRGRRGLVRRCHGDLHLRNITLLNGVPTPFDAIEFDERIPTVDILYDLAFLLMDLSERGLPAEANLVLNRYLWGAPDLAGELEGLAALPLFMSLRAAVRAKVEALRLLETDAGGRDPGEARRYFAFACAFMAGSSPRLVAIGGLSGTGKSTVAARLAPGLGRAPGAVHLRSDIERKRLLGAGELDRLPEAAYAPPVTERVFAALREQAALALAAGQAVIVDAVHRRPEEREALAAVAAATGVPFTGLWLDAPVETASARVSARHDDASDATAAIVAHQAAQPTGPVTWERVDASGSIEDVLRAATALIEGQSFRSEAK